MAVLFTDLPAGPQIKCEEEIDTLQNAVRQVVADLMAGSHSPSAARTLLPHLPSLTHLLGPRYYMTDCVGPGLLGHMTVLHQILLPLHISDC